MENTEKLIIQTLDKIRPFLKRDGGDVEFVSFKDGIVYVRMQGACDGCAYMGSTLKDTIEVILMEEVPGIIGVESAKEN
jgi:Fe-S cluster biogenesis protein NfuA